MDQPEMHKYIRRIWLTLGILMALVVAGIILVFFQDKPPTIQRFAGENGRDGINGNNGESIQGPRGVVGYTPVKGVDYFDGLQGPQGVQGIQGEPGLEGQQGPVGPQGDQGPVGVAGQDGKSPEFRCNEGDYQWHYAGDEDWQTVKENSLACQEAP